MLRHDASAVKQWYESPLIGKFCTISSFYGEGKIVSDKESAENYCAYLSSTIGVVVEIRKKSKFEYYFKIVNFENKINTRSSLIQTINIYKN